MKSIYFFVAFALFMMTGCKSDEKNAEEEKKRIFQIEKIDENTGLQQMQVSQIQQEITCNGKKYQFSVLREPAKDLPQVKSDMGLFLDNRITVKILRENGSKLFEKVFTKKDFAEYLTEEYLSHSVLEGLVFDDVSTSEKNVLTLVASVSYPMTDLYTPFSIVVSETGKMTLSLYEDKIEYTPLEENIENATGMN